MAQSQYSQEIKHMVERARAAQMSIEYLNQDEVRHIARCIGVLGIRHAVDWSEFTLAETGLGCLKSKIERCNSRVRGMIRDLNTAKSVGVIEVDEARQLIKIAKPVGVVAGLIPMTVPVECVLLGMMNAIVGRNAYIFAPHPRAQKTVNLVCAAIRQLFERLNLPQDLCQCMPSPSAEKTGELMRQCDLVVATGGAGMVKAAYSSGTPAFGVGAGNVVSVLDEDCDYMDAAQKLCEDQVNDLAIGCSTENAVVIHKSVYDKAISAMVDTGAYVCSAHEKALLQKTLWVDGRLNPKVICRPAPYIAECSGFSIPEDRTWLIVEETEYGPDHPFSHEKLSVVVAAYKFDSFDQAIAYTNGIQSYSGAGHSCGIFSKNEEHIQAYALAIHTSRVAVNMGTGKCNAGNWNNGMPFSINLGCGTWGGNITSENITYKNYLNTTWVVREIPGYKVPEDDELFGEEMRDAALFDGI